MNNLLSKLAPVRPLLAAAGILSLATLSLLSSPQDGLAAAKAKFRSAHFIVTALEKKGLKVEDVRRKGQLYIVKASEAGTVALLAIDGYSAELVGLHVLSLAPGAVAKPKGSGTNHYVDLTTEYGYVVEETTFESYTEVTSAEISTSEEYSETSISSSEEVSYEAVDDGATGDLDEGMPGDEEGDAVADADDGGDDAAASADDDGAGDDGAADDDASGGDDGGSDEE